ncbi:TIGR03086 family metal-binding protein [Yinghuangia sp. YIM S09857]|uniref:TIGR03086 family metal-binding protein n=1 Tax=Yinghuangia sp. YIM S09857 TaxID=3436929 RepID=UPI003F53BE30
MTTPETPAPSATPGAVPGPDFGPAVKLVADLAAQVRDDQLDAPTPCEEYRVRHLLGHLVGLTAAFRDAARKDLGPSTATNPGSVTPDVDADWRTALPRQLGELADAWRVPEAWEGMTQAGGLTFPAAVAGPVALNEVLIHGWDLARALGEDYPADRASLESSFELLAPNADADGDAEDSLFGPVVPVPDDADLLDRVIGLAGRDPGWTRP